MKICDFVHLGNTQRNWNGISSCGVVHDLEATKCCDGPEMQSRFCRKRSLLDDKVSWEGQGKPWSCSDGTSLLHAFISSHSMQKTSCILNLQHMSAAYQLFIKSCHESRNPHSAHSSLLNKTLDVYCNYALGNIWRNGT
jgi:hypothetical protein